MAVYSRTDDPKALFGSSCGTVPSLTQPSRRERPLRGQLPNGRRAVSYVNSQGWLSPRRAAQGPTGQSVRGTGRPVIQRHRGLWVGSAGRGGGTAGLPISSASDLSARSRQPMKAMKIMGKRGDRRSIGCGHTSSTEPVVAGVASGQAEARDRLHQLVGLVAQAGCGSRTLLDERCVLLGCMVHLAQ
jgi:hypothetical protein